MSKWQLVTNTVLLMVFLSGGPLFGQSSHGHQVNDAEQWYLKGDYTAAQATMARLEFDKLTQLEKEKYFHLKARLSVVFDKSSEMQAALKKLYDLNPHYDLDVYVDTPQMFSYWSELRKSAPPEALSNQSRRINPISYVPLGIGHFYHDEGLTGTLFFGSELAILLIGVRSYSRSEKNNRLIELVPFAFLGLWGYELHLINWHYGSPGSALSKTINWFPFGVPQAKNGQGVKAFLFAAAQAAMLVYGMTGDGRDRGFGYGGFGLLYAYGVYDGYSEGFANQGRHTQSGLGLRPTAFAGQSKRDLGYGFELTYGW